MSSSNVTTVVNHFPTANEGFITTLGSTILSGATEVPLTTTSGLTNGTVFVGIIEPGTIGKEQTFTGTVDTSGNQITGVKWTRGSNTGHNAGVTVVDYVSGTGNNMFTKGILVEHTQAGRHAIGSQSTITSAKFITDLSDTNGNELLKLTATASAVNELTIANAATGNNPSLTASGGDTNIGLNIASKGTGEVQVNGVAMSGAWTSWTPTWSGLTISSSTVVAKYKQIGKLVNVVVSVVAAGSFAISSSVKVTNLPVSISSNYTSRDVLGNLVVYDTSTGTYFMGQVWRDSATSVELLVGVTDTTFLKANGMGTTTPMTWANGDEIRFTFSYEAA